RPGHAFRRCGHALRRGGRELDGQGSAVRSGPAAGRAAARRLHRPGPAGRAAAETDRALPAGCCRVAPRAIIRRAVHAMNKADREEFFRRLKELDPEPTTELEYDTPFELLVAVILSAQATDVGVNKATRRPLRAANPT